MKSSVCLLLLLASVWLLNSFKVSAQTVVDPTESIKLIQEEIKPVINWAADWGYKVGFGITGAQLFYTVVIQLVKK